MQSSLCIFPFDTTWRRSMVTWWQASIQVICGILSTRPTLWWTRLSWVSLCLINHEGEDPNQMSIEFTGCSKSSSRDLDYCSHHWMFDMCKLDARYFIMRSILRCKRLVYLIYFSSTLQLSYWQDVHSCYRLSEMAPLISLQLWHDIGCLMSHLDVTPCQWPVFQNPSPDSGV